MFKYFKHVNPFSQVVVVRKFSTQDKKLIDMVINDKTRFATITLQRLPVNSLNLELITELASTLDLVEESRCKGMILTSASDKVFSAGLDLFDLYKPNTNRLRATWTKLQELWLKLYGSSYPTVAAINGHSPAGGCLLAVGCEYRIMVNNFTIGFNEPQFGIIAPSWCQAAMRNTLSKRDAEVALTLGKMFSTEEAYKAGLVDEIALDKTDALVKAEQFLLKFKHVSQQARTITKLALRSKDLKALQENREHDLNLFADAVEQPDVQQMIGMYIQSLKAKK